MEVSKHGSKRQRKPIDLNGVLSNAMKAVSDAKVAVAEIQNMTQIDPAPDPRSHGYASKSGSGKSQGTSLGDTRGMSSVSMKQNSVTVNNSARMMNGTFINIVGCQNIQIGDNNRMYVSRSNHYDSSDSEDETEEPLTDSRNRMSTDEDTAELLRDSHRHVSDAELQRLSRHVGGAWRRLIRLLGIEDAEVDYIFHTHSSDGLEEVVYQLLRKWKQENANPTVGELICALERANMKRLLRHLKP